MVGTALGNPVGRELGNGVAPVGETERVLAGNCVGFLDGFIVSVLDGSKSRIAGLLGRSWCRKIAVWLEANNYIGTCTGSKDHGNC